MSAISTISGKVDQLDRRIENLEKLVTGIVALVETGVAPDTGEALREMLKDYHRAEGMFDNVKDGIPVWCRFQIPFIPWRQR